MPRKPLDSRILRLATQADVKVLPPDISMVVPTEPIPEHPTVWTWCDITLVAAYGGIQVSETLTGMSFPGPEAFERSASYTRALHRVLAKLLSKLDAACEALAALGSH